MLQLRVLWSRIQSQFRRRQHDDRLNEEIAAHLEMEIEANVRRGMTAEDARFAALRAFGGVEQMKEIHRDTRGFAWLDALRQDVMYARRTLAKSPGFALTAVVVLGLAIGANTALFTFFNGYVLKPLAIPDGQRNYEIYATRATGNYDHIWSYSDYRQFRENNNVFDDTYAYLERDVAVLDPEAMNAHVRFVSGNFFGVLGGRTILGRPLTSTDDAVPGRDAVLVLSHAYWTRLFHRDPLVIGKTLRIRQRVFTVIGVADPEFSGTSPVVPDLWIPLAMSDEVLSRRPLGDPEAAMLFIGGILKPDVSLQQAHDSVLSVILSLNPQHPTTAAVKNISLYSRATYIPLRSDILAVAIPVFVLFGLVLLIACADLANLLLARAASRQRETAVRLALGASRLRLIRQFLTESLILSTAGATFGYLLAQTGIEALQAYVFSIYAKLGFSVQPLSMDWRVYVYTAGVAAAAGIAFGLAPALEATNFDLSRSIKQEGSLIGITMGITARPRRITDLLVTSQVAASLVLMVLAGLLIRNAQHVAQVNPGYDLDALIDIRLDGSKSKMMDRLKTDSRIASMTEVWRTPLYSYNLNQLPALVEGKSESLGFSYVDDRYFSTMEIPVTRGRNFIRQELTADARVAIVSEATARRLWPGGDPIGRVFQVSPGIAGSRFTAGTYQVVGVVGDVVSAGLSIGKDPTSVYFPVVPGDPRSNGLIVRARGAAPQLVAGLRRTCAELDNSSSCQPVTLREAAWLQVFPYKIASNVASWVGLLALVLTCVGLYGVVAFAVVQRTREFGIRMALGASRVDVLSLVLRRSLRQVVLGVAIGIPLCLALSKYTGSVIWMLETFDVTAYVVTPLLLIGVAMTASFLPARRATVVEPMVVLREE